jgi:hypothetical protein
MHKGKLTNINPPRITTEPQISTYFGGAKGGANQEIIHLHLLSLFDSVCQHVT